ncbi:MAG: HD domain-containing protein [Capsulimonadales bacterium]|nr:HD domain-containing protein [Capsulimonadales bacterium]
MSFLSPTAALSALTDPKAITEFAWQQRLALQERWNPGRGGRYWMQDHAALLDAVIKRLFSLSTERANRTDNEGIAIIATGGYGQRLLAPGSDLDVTFLSARDDDPDVLRIMFTLITDVLMSGLRVKVGYFYCTLADVAGGVLDHHRQTSFLDARLICGDGNLFARFDRIYAASLQTADFLFRKETEYHRRRARPEHALYSVEPDVKNGTGGLRDLQTASWMGRVRFHRPGEALWRDLVRRRVVTREDMKDFGEAREFLLTVRCGLHFAAGDRRDLLSRQRQEEVAARLGFREASDIPDIQGFMERYYSAAAGIARIADKVVTRCMESPIELGHETGLSSVRRRVSITDPRAAEGHPLWPFLALDYCQTHELELSVATEEAVQRYLARTPFAEEETHREAGRILLSLLARPGDAVATLHRMHKIGLLQALLPEFDRCMTLMPYDPSHVHTIGEHSLNVLGNILELRDRVRDTDPLLGRYRAVLKTLEEPLPLYLAALLHDIGKQWPHDRSGTRRPHEETGAERVPEIGARLNASRDVIADTEFLVRQHLLLAATSRLRDLGHTDTIREVARLVGDVERLRMLYLLTWADTRAVGPGVLTEMNARLLTELFERTEAFLEAQHRSGSEAEAAETARLNAFRERLQRQLARDSAAIGPEAIREHVQAMPAAYLLNTPPEAMSKHLAMIARLREGTESVVLDLRTTSPENGQTEITVVTWDAPALLAKLTGVLVAWEVPLHRAQVFTRETGQERIAIDTLLVDHHGRPLSTDRRAAVDRAIREVLSGQQTVADLLARRRKTFTMIQTIRSLRVDDTASADYTVLDVETPDETGVVYRLAALMTGFGWNIHAARVTAWGGSARCAFYLTDAAGKVLPALQTEAHLRDSLPLA